MKWLERLTGYKLEPALPIAEVERFEECNRIVLPAEYRTFITTICSGIYTEPCQPGRLTELLCPPSLDLDESLCRPFPFREYQPFDDDEAYERARNGALYVATDGCTCDWYLIITGPERGGMWEIEADGAQPCVPKLTFLPWLQLRIDCDSGRNSIAWWDAVWRDVRPAERTVEERYGPDEYMLKDAIRASSNDSSRMARTTLPRILKPSPSSRPRIRKSEMWLSATTETTPSSSSVASRANISDFPMAWIQAPRQPNAWRVT